MEDSLTTDSRDIEEQLRRRRRRQSAVRCCRQTIAFIFSHVGLAATVVAYSIAGGFLFRSLEAPLETERRATYGAMKQADVDEIVKLVDELVCTAVPSGEWQRNFSGRVLATFARFQGKVFVEDCYRYIQKLKNAFLMITLTTYSCNRPILQAMYWQLLCTPALSLPIYFIANASKLCNLYFLEVR